MSDSPEREESAAGAIWHFLIGRPLRAREATKERITPVEGLSALSLDALTSVAYGPEAIILVLAVAGAGALHLIVPITGAIVLLLVVLVFSYRQVIDAYPGGGGAYAVSRANLGTGASLVAAAALVVDYTLTVAVSIAAGVGSLTSAFPRLTAATVPICLGILAVITLFNLRGLGEAARAFLLPTMLFIVGLLGVILVGLVHPLGVGEPMPGKSLLPTGSLQAVTVLLVLKAFSAGCSALTGVEAIANGVPLFKEPRVKRAKRTEALLGTILGLMLAGLAVLARRWQIGPRSGQTVLSQIMSMAVGRHLVYYLMSLTITVVLALAANTSFGGLPVLASLLARDNYLPHIFSIRDDRQVFGNGVWALTVFSGALIIAVGGNTNTLIPLFAIGVFTGFTLAQIGLVVHWRRVRSKGWQYRAAVNGVGAVATAISTVIFLLTKFTEGAWVVVVAVPALIVLFTRIRKYYAVCGLEIGIGTIPPPPDPKPPVVVVPVTGVSRLTEVAISEALSLAKEVVAVAVVAARGDTTGDQREKLEREWDEWDPGVPLRILDTDYASVVDPIVGYVDHLREDDGKQVVMLIPVLVPKRLRYQLLHNHIDYALTRAMRSRRDVVVARVWMPVERGDDRPAGVEAEDRPAGVEDQPGNDPAVDRPAGNEAEEPA